MEPTLDYASPSVTSGGAPPGRSPPVLRVVLAIVYLFCWAGVSAFGGSLGIGVLGETFLHHELGPLRDDDFWSVGAVLGVIVGLTLTWRLRRFRWFHVSCMVLGAVGVGCAVFGAVRLYGSKEFLWELAMVVVAISAVWFIALVAAGVTGLLLRRLGSR